MGSGLEVSANRKNGSVGWRSLFTVSATHRRPVALECDTKGMVMRYIMWMVLLVFVSGCSISFTTHDEDRAAQLVEKLLNDIQSSNGIKNAYESTHEKFKETVSPDAFNKIVSNIRDLNSGATIRIVGYEIVGTEEFILIHASSDTGNKKIYYRFALLGTKLKDYSLLNINLSDHPFQVRGVYKEFVKPLEVSGL